MMVDGTYPCKRPADMVGAPWEGFIRLLSGICDPYEFEVKALGNWFHLLLGSHSYGNYLCVVNRRICCEVAGLNDVYWNLEKLREAGLPEADAISIVNALVRLDGHVTL
jgi:hypothetical protein